MKNIMIVAFTFLLFSNPPIANAEEPYIFAAGMKLTLGMERDVVLNNLKKSHKVDKFEDLFGNDSWFVHDLETNKVVAQVSFKDGVLSWAAHNWATFDANHKSFWMAKSLFELISKITASESALALVTSETKIGTASAIEEIELSFQNKKVSIGIINLENQQTVQIVESIFK